ncbi:hypothetical protein [Streptosporangium sp. NPDC051022]|uniref:hypothetical protein n=1 Tax=Streptosporangium sp. NPDC051022 TaxID=3155752 RepID=UPI003419C14A
MSSVSDRFPEVAEKATAAQQNVQSALAEDRKKLSAAVEQAKDKAAEGAQKLKDDGARVRAGAKSTWDEAQAKWQQHVTAVKNKIQEQRAAWDRSMAEDRAADAEWYAGVAIDFALSAIEEAEYATLEAVLARAEADETTG